jgi:hypothetical protein
MFHEQLGQPYLRLDVEQVRHVNKSAGLIRQGLCQTLVPVSQYTRGDSCNEIKVLPSATIRDPTPAAFHEHDRRTTVRVKDVSSVPFHEIVRIQSRASLSVAGISQVQGSPANP